ncbi:hypothetical protein [Pseudomonas sp. ok266]|uniref:hypothetical protein n=1 Tax=Pseudomonas sp. ok266 TaxID=1761896 RepID=UPI0008D62A95|nr:hypothetical protein [Pseudomonas sp. ok266]SEM93203.1 hypothetical protein SAMN04487856_101351 [Pseudomonas sp. ok266]
MPIVFVHGVNNRDGAEYRESEVGRNGFLKELVAPALGADRASLQIFSPYWGDAGAKFAWGMAALPNPDDKFESFGGMETGTAEGVARGRVAGLWAESPQLTGDRLDDARRHFPEIVDLLYASAMAGAKTEAEAQALAQSYAISSTYAVGSTPDWVMNPSTTVNNLVDQLVHHTKANQVESFGAGAIISSLKEAWSRLAHAVPDKATDAAGKLLRKKLNANFTRFTGDAFTYFAQRVTGQGRIVSIVLDELLKADAARRDGDQQLTVIAHSFGGEIIYDLATHYAPKGLQIDCLITVGSQVGLFEEMKLFRISQENLPPDPPKGRLPRPAKISRWLNVFDTNDPFSYQLEPIFGGVSDYHYDTGYGAGGAHGGYFQRPSFYKRLAARLTKG